MKFKRKLFIEKGSIDLTPLVNVFFILLVFFIFTSSFIFQPGIKVSLPKAVTAEVLQFQQAVLTITKENKLYLEDREVTPEALASRFHSIGQEKGSLLIKADSSADYGTIVKIWDMCRSEGVSQVSIATSQ